ncbi:MAG: glycosyltransferase [Cytophagales bacterium]|nr:glycosyltransferase [Cytophagales bacterium]
MEWMVIAGYGVALLVICIFSLGQFNLAWHYMKAKKIKADTIEPLDEYPRVVVQLPIYNELYVVDRLLECVSKLKYPKDKLEIQVLDDSDDETLDIVRKKINELKGRNVPIEHVRRPDRVGYKAGALQYGMQKTDAEFIAIFDADFLPEENFLLKTIAYFKNEKTGMVQTRWGHLNQNYSLLTQMQAFGLNAHFTVEQKGRQAAGSFINFNGTAGVWRKKCIEDSGGWQHDTLTEDLDLSYRAQLKGWKFQFLEDVVSPAELPVLIPAVRSQQYRWTKGAAETARKTLMSVIKSPLELSHKVRAVLHLLNSTVFLFLLIAAVLSIPMLYIKEFNPQLGIIFDLGSIFLIGFFAMGLFYWVSTKTVHPEYTFKFFASQFPLFLTFSMGLALHNSIAVIEGFFGVKTPFIRTPKYNIQSRDDSWKNNIYLEKVLTPVTLMEGLLALYFIFGIVSGIRLGDYGLVFFHGMLAFGFGFIFLKQLMPINKNA